MSKTSDLVAVATATALALTGCTNPHRPSPQSTPTPTAREIVHGSGEQHLGGGPMFYPLIMNGGGGGPRPTSAQQPGPRREGFFARVFGGFGFSGTGRAGG